MCGPAYLPPHSRNVAHAEQADKFETAGYLGMTLKTLEDTYRHHHPDHQSSVGNAFSKKKAPTG
jgi:hypothetical protein